MWSGAQRSTLVLGPAALGEDIFPGHTQYLAVRGCGRLDLDQARRHAGDRAVAQLRRVGVPLRPERRGRVPARRRTRRLVTVDDRLELGRGGRDGGRDGRCQPAERAARRRAPLDRAGRRAAVDPAARRRTGGLHAERAALDRPPQRCPGPRDPRFPRRRGRRRPICWPGSWPPMPGSSRASGPPHRACSPPTAPEGALASTAHAATRPRRVLRRPQHPLRLLVGAAAAAVRPSRGGHHRRRARRRLRPRPATGAAARRPSWPSTRSPTSPPSPTCRPW